LPPIEDEKVKAPLCTIWLRDTAPGLVAGGPNVRLGQHDDANPFGAPHPAKPLHLFSNIQRFGLPADDVPYSAICGRYCRVWTPPEAPASRFPVSGVSARPAGPPLVAIPVRYGRRSRNGFCTRPSRRIAAIIFRRPMTVRGSKEACNVYSLAPRRCSPVPACPRQPAFVIRHRGSVGQ
jgi:hypothetical protein